MRCLSVGFRAGLKLARTELQTRTQTRRVDMEMSLRCCTRFLSFAPLHPPSSLLQTCALWLLVGFGPNGNLAEAEAGRKEKSKYSSPPCTFTLSCIRLSGEVCA